MHGWAGPRLIHGQGPSERGAFSIFTRVGLRQGVLAVLQQRQFRQRLFHISPPRRARIAFQKFLVGFLCLRGLRKMIALELRNPQQCLLAMFVRGIFAHQEFVGIGSQLVIGAPEAIAHFGVKFRNRQQGIRHFRRARRDHFHAPVTHHHLFVIGERSLIAGFRVESGALLFRSRKLCGGGLAFYRRGGFGGVPWRRGDNSGCQEKAQRKGGEDPKQTIFLRRHPAAPANRSLYLLKHSSRFYGSRCRFWE